MNIKEKILKLAVRKKKFSANDVLKSFKGKYTRAYILRFINALLKDEKLVKLGSTRGAFYAVKSAKYGDYFFEKRYINKNLKEHEILEEFTLRLPFLRILPEHLRSIFSYAFSEMVNNAMDHSKSPKILVTTMETGKGIVFEVKDSGVGVFRNVMKKRKLKSEMEAIQDLLKGKTTTLPRAHSGEGIFFTSKVVDLFSLKSYGYQLRIDNRIKDIFINEFPSKKRGTCVTFAIDKKHKGHLNDVFKRYYTDPEEFAFDKTEIQIKLYTMGSIYVSRSQAKRVLVGLEKFRTIIFDFDQVPGIGQAFADEIFRVFKNAHPEITLTPMNMNEAVRFMVERVGE